ncbi:Copia protein, partial [Mucuna pruriens]
MRQDKKVDQTSYRANPRESHLTVVKHFFKYLKDRKSTNRRCHVIGVNLVSWSSKRQGNITLSIVEHQLEDYGIFESNILLLCDSTTVINFSKSPLLHSHLKHIENKHHFIRNYVQKGTLDLKFISIENQLANIFTKPLPEDKLGHIKNLLGITFIME